MRRCAARLLVALALFVVAGCGLADYEKHIDEQRERVKLADEENKLLDDPLLMPVGIHPETKAEAPVWPVDIFVRPPKDVARVPSKESPYVFNAIPLYRYAGPPGVNVFLAIGPVADKAAGKEAEALEDFRHKVRGALADYYRSQYRAESDFPVGARPTRDKRQPEAVRGPAQPLEFLRLDFKTGKQDFFLFFLQRSNMQAAIVYEMPAGKRDVERTLDCSLKSIDTENAQAKRTEYDQRRRGK